MRASRNKPLKSTWCPAPQSAARCFRIIPITTIRFDSPIEEIVAAFARQDDMVCHDSLRGWSTSRTASRCASLTVHDLPRRTGRG